MSKNKIPELSVIIINHNGSSYATRCIQSVLQSNTKSLEVILVDNGSTKTDVSKLKNRFGQKVKFVCLKRNYGPARARNEGVKQSRGAFIAFLDNDTKVQRNWAINAIEEFKKSADIGIIQCKLLLMKDPSKLDYVGEHLGQNGFLVQRARGGETDSGKYDQKVEILAAKSAGMFIRRRAFLEAGGFDNDYFIYVEETDLGWRSWLRGYRTIFLPTSIVFHEFGTSNVILSKSQNTYNAKFHGSKNYILTLIKNLGTKSLMTMLPVHIVLWLGLAVYIAFRGDLKSSFWILNGIAWNVTHLQQSLKKRRRIQRNRKLQDRALFAIVLVRKPFYYFVHKVTKKHIVGNAKSF